MLVFVGGLVIGLALGMIVVGFLAVTAYHRGYDEAFFRRRQWRAEIVARRAAGSALPVVAVRKAS